MICCKYRWPRDYHLLKSIILFVKVEQLKGLGLGVGLGDGLFVSFCWVLKPPKNILDGAGHCSE